MSIDRTNRERNRRAAWIAVGLTVVMAATAWAQPDWEWLRQQVEESYQVIPLRDGVLLRAIDEGDVGTIELGGGEIVLDGERVSRRELEDRLGVREAERMQPLAELDPDELKALFGHGDPDRSPAARQAVEEEAELARLEALDTVRDDTRDQEADLRDELEERQEEIRELEAEIRDRARDLRDTPRDDRRRRHHRTDAQVMVGSGVHVGADEHSGEIVSLGGPVTIDGAVSGGVVAIGGPVRINGQVSGDVVAVGGRLELTSDADVNGSVAAIGGGLEREPGARVSGEITEVNLWDGTFGPVDLDWGMPWWPVFHRSPISNLFERSLKVAFLTLIGALLLAVARGPMDRVARRVAREPWKAGAVGISALIFFFPALIIAIVLLCISIIGIPLLILVPFGVLGFVLVAFFGFVTVAYQLGRWSAQRFGWRLGSAVLALVVGLLWIYGWGITAEIIDVIDTPNDFAAFFVIMLIFFGFMVKLCAWSVGIGAVILARFGEPLPDDLGAIGPPPLPEPLLGTVDPSDHEGGDDDAGVLEAADGLADGDWASFQDSAERESESDPFFGSASEDAEADRPDETGETGETDDEEDRHDG